MLQWHLIWTTISSLKSMQWEEAKDSILSLAEVRILLFWCLNLLFISKLDFQLV